MAITFDPTVPQITVESAPSGTSYTAEDIYQADLSGEVTILNNFVPYISAQFYGAGLGSYIDLDSKANDDNADDVDLPPRDSVDDALYIGHDEKFDAVLFDISTPGEYDATLVWEYWNGSDWVTLNVTDNTSGFTVSGLNFVSFEQPDDWTQCDVNGKTKYWIRVRCSALNSVTTQPKASQLWLGLKPFYFSPADSKYLKLDYVVTAGSTAGGLYIYGKTVDSTSDSLNGEYALTSDGTTPEAFSSISYFFLNGDQTVSIIQPRWGAVYKYNDNVYWFRCRVDLLTSFKETNKILIFGEVGGEYQPLRCYCSADDEFIYFGEYDAVSGIPANGCIIYLLGGKNIGVYATIFHQGTRLLASTVYKIEYESFFVFTGDTVIDSCLFYSVQPWVCWSTSVNVKNTIFIIDSSGYAFNLWYSPEVFENVQIFTSAENAIVYMGGEDVTLKEMKINAPQIDSQYFLVYFCRRNNPEYTIYNPQFDVNLVESSAPVLFNYQADKDRLNPASTNYGADWVGKLIYPITFKVVDSDGSPVGGAKITLTSQTGTEYVNYTDVNGYASFEPVFNVYFTPHSYTVGTQPAGTNTIYVQNTADFEGMDYVRVYDSTGVVREYQISKISPGTIELATNLIADIPDDRLVVGGQDIAGSSFYFKNVPEAPFDIKIEAEGYTTYTSAFDILNSGTYPVTLDALTYKHLDDVEIEAIADKVWQTKISPYKRVPDTAAHHLYYITGGIIPLKKKEWTEKDKKDLIKDVKMIVESISNLKKQIEEIKLSQKDEISNLRTEFLTNLENMAKTIFTVMDSNMNKVSEKTQELLLAKTRELRENFELKLMEIYKKLGEVDKTEEVKKLIADLQTNLQEFIQFYAKTLPDDVIEKILNEDEEDKKHP